MPVLSAVRYDLIQRFLIAGYREERRIRGPAGLELSAGRIIVSSTLGRGYRRLNEMANRIAVTNTEDVEV